MSYEIKKGEYVVPLTDKSSTNNWNNWVLKQRTSGDYVRPEICPNTGETTSGWSTSYALTEGVDWRYATQIEISSYDKNGGPVKVDQIITAYEIY
jgi:hypothetical protein